MENPQQNINKLIPTMYKKKYTPLPSGTYSRCARLIQHLKNQSCNPYIKKEKDSYLINWCQNILQNSIPIHDLKKKKKKHSENLATLAKFPNIKKIIYKKIYNKHHTLWYDIFSLKFGRRRECPFLALLFNTVLGVLAGSIR